MTHKNSKVLPEVLIQVMVCNSKFVSDYRNKYKENFMLFSITGKLLIGSRRGFLK